MSRTLVNVMGDVVCAAFIENVERTRETRAPRRTKASFTQGPGDVEAG